MTKNFYDLTPDEVLAGIESLGLEPTGEFTQLNSYENRVFEVRLEDNSLGREKLISKCYRPQRGSYEAITAEHRCLFDLNSAGIQVVARYQFDGETVFEPQDI